MKLDEVYTFIIRSLKNGRRSFSDIAKKLGITTNTVRSRVTKLTELGVLDVQGLVDPQKLDNHFLVIIGVKLNAPTLVKTGEAFAKLKGVVSVAVVTGRFDLMVVALLNNEFGLMEFYTQEVSKIKEVVSTETFVVYKNYDFKVPYIL